MFDCNHDQSPLPEPLLLFEPVPASVSEVLSRLDSLKTGYAAARDSGRILANVVEAIRVELTYNSNAIEGNTLSLRETQLVIEGRSTPGGKSMRELYEARNHDRALREIEKWVAKRGPAAPITEQDLLDIHAIVLADIDPSAGQFRSHRVLITGTHFVPPGSQRFPELIPRMMALANRAGVHPVLAAAELHYNVAAVPPFADGNGRVARLMMNYKLLQNGFSHTIIEVAERAEYLNALDEANTGPWERFGLFVARSVERSTQKLLGT